MATKTRRRKAQPVMEASDDGPAAWFPYPRPPFVEYPQFSLRPVVKSERIGCTKSGNDMIRQLPQWELWQDKPDWCHDRGIPRLVAVFFDEALAKSTLRWLNGER